MNASHLRVPRNLYLSENAPTLRDIENNATSFARVIANSGPAFTG